jgi:hypothetical protein
MRFRAPAGSNIGSIALGDTVHRPDDDGIFQTIPDHHGNRLIALGWDAIDEPKIEGLTPAEVGEITAIVSAMIRRKLATESAERQREILEEIRAGDDDFELDDEDEERRPARTRPAAVPDSVPLAASSDETLKAVPESPAPSAG